MDDEVENVPYQCNGQSPGPIVKTRRKQRNVFASMRPAENTPMLKSDYILPE